MLLIRKLHTYFGLLIAPSVLFFALSGAVQLFSLHEAHGPYHPPTLLKVLGNIHKDQVVSTPEKHSGPPSRPALATSRAERPFGRSAQDTPKVKTYVLKWFFAFVAAGLFSSTLLGLWIALRFSRTPRLTWGLLIAGAAMPLLILLL